MRKNIVLLAIALFIALIAGIYNIFWNAYVNTIETFLSSPTLQSIPKEDYEIIRSGGREIHTYRDFRRSGYYYQVYVPKRFNTKGLFVMSTPDINVQSGTNARFSLMIFIDQRDWLYVLSIADLSTSDYNHTRSFSSAVDKHGQPLDRNPNDTEENYQEWLTLHERHYDAIMKMFSDMKDFFGEDSFR